MLFLGKGHHLAIFLIDPLADDINFSQKYSKYSGGYTCFLGKIASFASHVQLAKHLHA